MIGDAEPMTGVSAGIIFYRDILVGVIFTGVKAGEYVQGAIKVVGDEEGKHLCRCNVSHIFNCILK